MLMTMVQPQAMSMSHWFEPARLRIRTPPRMPLRGGGFSIGKMYLGEGREGVRGVER